MTSSTVGSVTDAVGDVLNTSKDVFSSGRDLANEAVKHLPEVTDSIGDFARSTAGTVADLATTAIALTPFVSESRGRRRPAWLVPVAIIAVLIGLAVWKKRTSAGRSAADQDADSNVAPLTRTSSAATG